MRKIFRVLASLIFVVGITLMFFGCKNQERVLVTPPTIGVVNHAVYDANDNYIGTELLLVTTENKNASKYRFYITDKAEYQNYDNYISMESNTNYIDVTDVFVNKTKYHYFVQYIGNKDYSNSAYTEIQEFTPSVESVDAPYVQKVDKKIYWVRIMHAESYDIYETIYNADGTVNTARSKIATVGPDVFEYDFSERITSFDSPYYTYEYCVKAKANGYYSNSALSNKIEYVKNITLDTPKNLRVEKEEDSYFLIWDKVDYATKYEIVVNGNTGNVKTSNENKLDVTEFFTSGGFATYSFYVKSVESEAIDYNVSANSQTLNYDYETTLSAPQNIEFERNGQYLSVTWNKVSLATNYEVKINYNGSEVLYKTNIEDENLQIDLTQIFANLDIDYDITVEIKANSSSNYINASSWATRDYKIEAQISEN